MRCNCLPQDYYDSDIASNDVADIRKNRDIAESDNMDALFEDINLMQRFFLSQYLDNPIISTGRTRLLTILMQTFQYERKLTSDQYPQHARRHDIKLCTEYMRVKKKGPTRHDMAVDILDPENYGDFIRSFRTVDSTDSASAIATYRVYHQALRGLESKIPGISTTAQALMAPRGELLTRWYQVWRTLDDVCKKGEVAMHHGTRVVVIHNAQIGRAVMNSSFIIWIAPRLNGDEIKRDLLMTWEQFLMMKDIAFARYQVLAARLWFYPNNPEYDSYLRQQWEWQEACLKMYGNEGYEIANKTESITKSYLSHLTDNLFLQDGPYPRMLDKIRGKEAKLGNTQCPLVNSYAALIESTCDLQLIVELFGCLKLCGYPLIDPARGGLSSAAEARIEDTTRFLDAQRLKNNFCRIYLEARVNSGGEWPELDFSDTLHGKETELHRLSDMRYRRLTPQSYPLTDWNTCRFKKQHEFTYYEDYLELMDDKSISYLRSDKHKVWTGETPATHKRCLIEMLRREEISPLELVERVMRRDIPLDWYIVSLYPKEREFKIAARMFSMLVFEMRLYFALTEANLAETIFPHIPQQTMTKDKITILRTFGDITRPLTSSSKVRYYLEIDLSRWNLRWRSLAVHMVGDALDDLFGLRGVYTFVHEFFEKCLILVRAPDIRPPGITDMYPPESDTVWYNHKGGFEGITQKLWSLCTYSMVDLGLQQFPLHYVLLGQGDNQVVTVTLNRDLSISTREQCLKSRNEIMSSLEGECAKVNQEMKPEECLESSTVLTYSKDVYIKGVDYHTTLKAHSRLFPHSSSEFPSVTGDVGTIFSTAYAGAERTRAPLISWALAYLHSHIYLMRVFSGEGIYGGIISSKIKIDHLDKVDFASFVLCVPSELGGISIPPLTSFLYKGGSDPLSQAVAGMKVAATIPGSVESRAYRQVQEEFFLNESPTIESLIQDPYGLPISKPVTPLDSVASRTRKELYYHTKNKAIKELLSVDTDSYLQELVIRLSTMDPMNPLIAHDLLETSSYGLVRKLGSMFVATQSIQELVRRGCPGLVEHAIHQEHLIWQYLIDRYLCLPTVSPNLSESIYERVSSLRKSWLRTGIKQLVGLTTYHPLDFDVVWGAPALSTTGICVLCDGVGDVLWSRGRHSPYLGSKTREKRSEHGYRIVGRDPASAGMRKLQLLMSQLGKDKGFKDFIDGIGRSRSNVTLSDISHQLTQVIGGTIGHRYASLIGFLAAHLLGSFALASHCIISSDGAGFLSGGFIDYPVMFQEYFLCAISFILWRIHAGGQIDDALLCTIRIGNDSDVLTPIPEIPLRLPFSSPFIPLVFPHNVLAYQQSLQLKESTSIYKTGSIDRFNIQSDIKRQPDLAWRAVRAWFREVLELHNNSRLIADSNPSVTRRPVASLDLAETISIGISALVDAAALVAAEEAIYNVWRTSPRPQTRWRMAPFLWKVCEALSLVISEHIGHPLLSRDRTIVVHSLHCAPRYSGGTSYMIKRLCGLLFMKARAHVSHTSGPLYSQTYALFSSCSDRGLSNLSLRAMVLLVHEAYLLGEVPPQAATMIVKQYVLPLGRNKDTEADRISSIQAVQYQLCDHCQTQGYSGLYTNMRLLASGSRIEAYAASTGEMMRDMRDASRWGLRNVMYHRTAQALIQASGCIPWRATMSTAVIPVETYDATTYVAPSTSVRLLRQALASSGRIWGLHSAAHYHFVPLISLFPGVDVLIIGAGHGAVARLALESGARMVYGHDLRQDLPLDNHSFRWYIPPMVASSPRQDRYRQTIQSFSSSGDWYYDDVATSVLGLHLPSTMVIFDIHQSRDGRDMSHLLPLIEKNWRGVCCWRTFLDIDLAQLTLLQLRRGGGAASMYRESREHTSASCLYVITRLPRALRYLTPLRMGTMTPGKWSVPDLSAMGGGFSDLCSAAVHFTTVYLQPPSMDLMQRNMESLYLGMRGEYESRPTYIGWTVILEGLTAVWWLSLPRRQQGLVLCQIGRSERLNVIVRSVSTSVTSNLSLGRHLSKVVARLL